MLRKDGKGTKGQELVEKLKKATSKDITNGNVFKWAEELQPIVEALPLADPNPTFYVDIYRGSNVIIQDLEKSNNQHAIRITNRPDGWYMEVYNKKTFEWGRGRIIL